MNPPAELAYGDELFVQVRPRSGGGSVAGFGESGGQGADGEEDGVEEEKNEEVASEDGDRLAEELAGEMGGDGEPGGGLLEDEECGARLQEKPLELAPVMAMVVVLSHGDVFLGLDVIKFVRVHLQIYVCENLLYDRKAYRMFEIVAIISEPN
ncbi:hypothetical protein PanWU01x14_191740 [Parasponia andersonii]|uniref:Uncharacterized protein n=1 Tax=Parasponia andersonii TaxID=3476 RepID=A0A2P5C1K6_PARAD|nr:hypothetical protein PanWU01x14_191740 [Parasponia andersonii]